MSADVVVRLYLNGELADEQQFPFGAGREPGEELAELAARHGTLCRDVGSWMIEFAFPDGQHIRWGTDADGMVQPVPVDDLFLALARQINEYRS
jgi:hypothetical protein